MVDNHIINNTSYISIVHISDESKPSKTFIDVSSLSSIATSNSSRFAKSRANSSVIHIKYNNLNKNRPLKMDGIGLIRPVYNRINDNCYEEIFYTNNGEHDVETKIINQKNEDGSVDRTTITTSFFPDGEIKQEAFVETIFEESFSSSSSSLEKQNSDSPKRNYQLLYGMTKRQFDLMETYFKKLEKNGYIHKNELKSHILFQAIERKNVCKVKENQVSQAVDSLDSSDDNSIDFNQFIQFMSLFFSSKYNIRRKIVSVLNGQSYSHFEPGSFKSIKKNSLINFIYFLSVISKNIYAFKF